MVVKNVANSVVLIGMPGAGKSTLGVLLAKNLAKDFLDTDLLLQARIGTTLQEFMDEHGYLRLREEEGEVLKGQDFNHSIIATGGSAVYSDDGMKSIAQFGPRVFLSITYETLLGRVKNQGERGIACPPGYSLKDIYDERQALYEKYADITVKIDDTTLEEAVKRVIAAL